MNSQSCSLNGEEGGVSTRGNIEALDGVRSVVALSSREDDFGRDVNVVDGKSGSETDLTEVSKEFTKRRSANELEERAGDGEEEHEPVFVRSPSDDASFYSSERAPLSSSDLINLDSLKDGNLRAKKEKAETTVSSELVV